MCAIAYRRRTPHPVSSSGSRHRRVDGSRCNPMGPRQIGAFRARGDCWISKGDAAPDPQQKGGAAWKRSRWREPSAVRSSLAGQGNRQAPVGSGQGVKHIFGAGSAAVPFPTAPIASSMVLSTAPTPIVMALWQRTPPIGAASAASIRTIRRHPGWAFNIRSMSPT